MTDLTSLTLAEARDGLANKSFTSLELTNAHLSAIEAARVLNAFVLETPDRARAMAREIDANIARGEGGPPYATVGGGQAQDLGHVLPGGQALVAPAQVARRGRGRGQGVPHVVRRATRKGDTRAGKPVDR